MYRRIDSRSLLLHLALTALLVGALGMAPRPPADKHLWELVPPSPASDRTPVTRQPWIIREQKIRLHHQILDRLHDPEQAVLSGIVLDLTGETGHEMIIDSKTSGPLSTIVIQGRLAKVVHSDIMLVIKDRNIAGTIRLDNRAFRIQSTGQDEHLLIEIDPDKLPPD